MFTDPQSVTVNAVAQSLPAISRTADASIYQKDDGSYKLSVMHLWKPARRRFTIRLDGNKIAVDPLASANNLVYSLSTYLVLDGPTIGYTNAELQLAATGLIGWCTSANLLRVIGGET